MKQMRKLVALILAIVLTAGMVPVSARAAQKLYGDADGNGTVNAKDAMLVLQYYTKKIAADQLAADLCDVDGGGSINAKDAMLILQLYTKKLDKFPVDQNTEGTLCVVEFDLNDPDAEQVPGKQTLICGEYAVQPEEPVREGHVFLGWYLQKEPVDLSRSFSFTETPITEDLTLYAVWLDMTQNSDEDALPDETERRIGTDPTKADTDGDGFNDDMEAIYLNTNPLKAEDHNTIDSDGDCLVNAEEVRIGSNPCLPDTDFDGLTDFQEQGIGTSCTNADTDGDGASDGMEAQYGTDPLTAQTSFTDRASTGSVSAQNPVCAAVSAQVPGEALGTVQVRALDLVETPLLSSSIPGYMGYAYDFTAAEAIDYATLTFTYAESLGQDNENFEPRIYYFDPEAQTLTALENQEAKDGAITADVDHFSTYVLIDESKREENVNAGELWDALRATVTDGDTTDKNGDKIPDKYNVYIFLGMIPTKTGASIFAGYDFGEKADLDGDGLLNGEEVSIQIIDGLPYLAVKSMPIYLDSDFDGIDDKTEQEENTDPLQNDYHKTAVDGLMNRSIYGASLYYDEVYSSFVEVAANRVLTVAGWMDHGSLENIFKEQWLAYIQDYCTDVYDTTNKQSYQSYVYAENGKAMMDMLEKGIITLCVRWREKMAKELLKLTQQELDVANSGVKLLRDIRRSLLDNYFPSLIKKSQELGLEVSSQLLDTAKKVEVLSEEIEELSDLKNKSELKLDKLNIVEEALFLVDVGFSAIQEAKQLSNTIDTLAYVSANSQAYQELADVFYYVSVSSEISAARKAAEDLRALLTEQDALEKERAKAIAAACVNLLLDKVEDVVLDQLMAEVAPIETFIVQMVKDIVVDLGSRVGYAENMIFAASVLADGTAALTQASVYMGTKSYHSNESETLTNSYLTHLLQLRLLGEMKYHAMFHAKKEERERYQNILDKLQTYAGLLNLPISKKLLAETEMAELPNVSAELMVFDDPAAEGEPAVYFDAGALLYLNGTRLEESNAQIASKLGKAQRFYLQPGTGYALEARGEKGYTTCTQKLDVKEGEDYYLQLAVFSPEFADRKFQIKGKIVDEATDAAVANANLCFRPGHGTKTGEGVSAVTDTEGVAEAALSAGCYTVEISHPDYETEFREMHIYEDARKFTFTEGLKKKPGKIIASGRGDDHSGFSNNDITWYITEDGVLTVEGTGEVPIHCSERWYRDLAYAIKSIVIGPGVTYFPTSVICFVEYDHNSMAKFKTYYPKYLEAVSVHPDNSVYYSVGNCLIRTEGKELILGGSKFQIPGDGSVTSIGGAAFAGREGLKEIVIPETVVRIGNWAFADCNNLQSVTLPACMTSIGEGAFAGCNSLKELTIPEGIVSLNIVAPRWKVLILPSSLEYLNIENDASYSGSSNVWTDIYYPGTQVQWNEISMDVQTKNMLKNVTIHYNYQGKIIDSGGNGDITWSLTADGVLTVDGNGGLYFAFSDWYQYEDEIKTLVLGPGITSFPVIPHMTGIGHFILRKLESISVHPDNPVYHSAGNCLIDTKKKVLVLGGSNAQIPDDGSVVCIEGGAFAFREHLEQIVVPNSVTAIKDQEFGAFESCSNLQTVTLPDSLEKLEDRAFAGCGALKKLTIPEGLTHLYMVAPRWEVLILPSSLKLFSMKNDASSYGSYSGWTDIYYPGTQSQWNELSIDYQTKNMLKNVTIHYNYQG